MFYYKEIIVGDFRPSQVTGNVDVSSKQASLIAVGQQASVASGSMVTVATMVANGYDHVTKVSCSGQVPARWQLYIDSVLAETIRGGRNVEFIFKNPFLLETAKVLDIKVTHYHAGETPIFDATIYGFKG